ncbi:MAG: NUDIX hydrolase [Candidatus Omnitrophota bacterium]
MNSPDAAPQITGRTVEFETPWFKLISKTLTGMPGKSEEQTYYSVKPDDYVTTVASDKEGRLLLVRQYRPAVEDYTLELPAGHVEKNESPEDAAIRELYEETGHRPGSVDLLGVLIPDTGRMSNRMWCYFVQNAVPTDKAADAEEGVSLILCPSGDLKEHILGSRFNHSLHLSALMLAVVKGKLPALAA